MQTSRSVVPLTGRRDCIATLKTWFIAEWPEWYGPGGLGSIDQDLQAFAASSSALPVGMLVFEAGQLVGAAALKAESIPTHTHLGPWAGAGYVLPSHRGRGLGAFLLQSLVSKAHELGFSSVYCGTSTANSLLKRAGWQLVETTEHDGKPLGIYCSAGS